jgi:hypothetical protein
VCWLLVWKGKHWMSPNLASKEEKRFLVSGLMEMKERIETK